MKQHPMHWLYALFFCSSLAVCVWLGLTPSLTPNPFILNLSLTRFAMLLGTAVLSLAFGLLWLKAESAPVEIVTQKVIQSPVTALGVSLGFLSGLGLSGLALTTSAPVWLVRIFPLVALLLALSLTTGIFQALTHGSAPWKNSMVAIVRMMKAIVKVMVAISQKIVAAVEKVFPPLGNKKIDWIVLVAFSLLFAAFKVSPYVNFDLHPGLDPSWRLAHNWGSQLGLPWSGDSLVFTYGTLYYLTENVLPDFHSTAFLVILHVLINLAALLTCLAFLQSIIRSSRQKNLSSIFVALVFVILLFSKQQYALVQFLAVLLILPIVLGEQSRLITRLPTWLVSFFLLSTLALSKFTFMLVAGFFLLVSLIVCFLRKHYVDLLCLPIIFIATILFSWTVIGGQHLVDLPGFLSSSWLVSQAYTEAMSLGFHNQKVVMVFAITLAFATLLFLIFVVFRKSVFRILALLLPTALLFILFKNTFVRADPYHLQQFFASFPPFTLLLLILVVYPGTDEIVKFFSNRQAVTLLGLLILAFGGLIIILSQPRLSVSNPLRIIESVAKQGETEAESRRTALREAYNLDPEFVEQISTTNSIDVIPWEISLLYAYNLNWTPRPILQTYSAYTPGLENLDAAYFASGKAPEQLLFSYRFLDDRYLPYDMPATFRVLLQRYEFTALSSDGEFMLLTKKSTPAPLQEPALLSSGEYSLGQDIVLPQVEGGRVYARVEIDPTLLGRLANLAYKTPPISVTLETKDGPRSHVLVRSLGANGLFVSQYIDDIYELEAIFSGEDDPDVDSVCFNADPLFFEDRFEMSFYSIPTLPATAQ